jgi:hypothetical protein
MSAFRFSVHTGPVCDIDAPTAIGLSAALAVVAANRIDAAISGAKMAPPRIAECPPNIVVFSLNIEDVAPRDAGQHRVSA